MVGSLPTSNYSKQLPNFVFGSNLFPESTNGRPLVDSLSELTRNGENDEVPYIELLETRFLSSKDNVQNKLIDLR